MSDLPCPFCGNSAIVRSSVIPGRGFCEECGAEGPWSPYFEGDWNTRAPDPRVAALLETLDDVADECLSDEILEGYGPDLTENPEFHRGYDAALHRVRLAIAKFKEASRE